MISISGLKERIADKWSIFLVLFIVGLLLYWQTLTVGFISDDFGFVEDAQLRGWSAFASNFGDTFFIPVSHFLGLLLFKVTGGNPVLMHVTQLFVHVMISFQLYMLVREVGERLQKKIQYLRIALFAAIIFLVHPYQTEAVVWLAAKSYGYSLLFSILSARWFLKKNIYWSIFFLILAIHTKESGYFIPLTILLIAWAISFRVHPKYWITWVGVVCLSLLIRYLVLGELMGGYGVEVHSRIGILIFSIPFYVFKFFTLFKLTDIYTTLSLLTFIVSVSSVLALLFIKRIKMINIVWFMLLVLSLLMPVLTLEITSVSVIASDRYSYFALAAISFGIGYFLVLLKEKHQRGLIIILVGVMSFVTWSNNSIWVGSGRVKDQFLGALKQNVAAGDNVLLVNIPDTYLGVYCLRNGIEDYMRTQEVDCNIEIDHYQEFKTLNWGCYLTPVTNTELQAVMSYPDSLQLDRAFFINEKLELFDNVFIYRNGKLIKL